MRIPFNTPFMTGREIEYIAQAHAAKHLSGNGRFTRMCQAWLEEHLGCDRVLLTHSCTGALEMAAILADVGPGDEVIMPSYTFVSTANAFVLRGAVPVFVDIRPDTLNLDEGQIEAAITDRTRAIIPVHYAGVSAQMDAILAIAERHGLLVIEDAAQGFLAEYGRRKLGSLGHLGAVSFHETKNVIAGEGGALLINDARFRRRAEIVWEKGTDRAAFFRGEVDKYTWVDVGSSFLPGELVAAFLWAQLEAAEDINRSRHAAWAAYHAAFATLEAAGRVRRPITPAGCVHNAHMYYLLLPDPGSRGALIEALKRAGISAVFHYVPLHDSPAGRRHGRAHGELSVTREVSDRLVRLPLWVGMGRTVDRVIAEVSAFFERYPARLAA
jgi:dTDP-4-amino-4,6-dideoxygalactose transaminase